MIGFTTQTDSTGRVTLTLEALDRTSAFTIEPGEGAQAPDRILCDEEGDQIKQFPEETTDSEIIHFLHGFLLASLNPEG